MKYCQVKTWVWIFISQLRNRKHSSCFYRFIESWLEVWMNKKWQCYKITLRNGGNWTLGLLSWKSKFSLTLWSGSCDGFHLIAKHVFDYNFLNSVEKISQKKTWLISEMICKVFVRMSRNLSLPYIKKRMRLCKILIERGYSVETAWMNTDKRTNVLTTSEQQDHENLKNSKAVRIK